MELVALSEEFTGAWYEKNYLLPHLGANIRLPGTGTLYEKPRFSAFRRQFTATTNRGTIRGGSGLPVR
jgi:hypothetical protein